MSNNLHRIQWVDFAKGIAIILVIAAHVITKETSLMKFIYVFHMPFFFVMAGYLLNTEKWSRRFSEFKSKLERRLILPYFVGNFAFFPIWFILCHCLGIFVIYDWAERTPLSVLMAIFIGNNYNIGLWLILYPLWFLPSLFFAELIFLKVNNLFAKKIYSFYRIIIVLSAAGYILGTYSYFQLPLGMDISLVVQPFLLIGFLIRKNDFLHKINLSSFAVLLILFGTSFYFNGAISMNDRTYENIFLLYIGGITGSLILMKISMFLADFSNKIFDFIKYCGKQSMGILVFHIPAINVVYNLMSMVNKNIGELRHLPPEIDFMIIIFSVIVPALIIKNFKDKPIVKYFCV